MPRARDRFCGDTFAARFVDGQVRHDLAPALAFTPAAISNVGRHRIVDDLVRDRIATDPHRRIIVLGAGFDTRAYRLDGGRWFELDDVQLLEFKESRLPAADAKNRLERIPVAFDTTTADCFLTPLAGDDEAVVILEGVSMYLSDDTLTALARALVRHLPNATLVCDLMSPMFARTFSRGLRQALAGIGATFGERHVHPRVALERGGLSPYTHISIPGRTAELGALPFPRWLLATAFRGLRDGYQVWTFRRA
ncbi:MAG: class I SAM-dependent methyltransferase [Vicinamibacterales bacterium]